MQFRDMEDLVKKKLVGRHRRVLAGLSGETIVTGIREPQSGCVSARLGYDTRAPFPASIVSERDETEYGRQPISAELQR